MKITDIDEEIYHVAVESTIMYDEYYEEERLHLKIMFLNGPLKGKIFRDDISAANLNNETQ